MCKQTFENQFGGNAKLIELKHVEWAMRKTFPRNIKLNIYFIGSVGVADNTPATTKVRGAAVAGAR